MDLRGSEIQNFRANQLQLNRLCSSTRGQTGFFGGGGWVGGLHIDYHFRAE